MDLYSSKESIRKMVWDYLEEHDLAEFPRPVHHRIPNFKGAAEACNRLGSMEIFQKAKTIKVNPDKPQQQARFLALEAHKTLLVPTPRLRTGLFNRITPPPGANKKMLRTCSSSQGVRQYSSPVGLDAEVKVDLVLIGSVAVSPKGYRIGKGEGYADMEFAMMSSMGAVDQDTVVITTVHDCQIKDDLPEYLFGEHDLGVDFIVTPTRTIRCENKRARPKGIAWELLTREKFFKIPVLTMLRRREAEMGIDVRLKEEREGCLDSPTAVSSKDFFNSKEERGGSLDSSTAVSSKEFRNSKEERGGSLDSSTAVSSKEFRNSKEERGGSLDSSTAVSSKVFRNSKEERGGSLDSFKAASSKDLYHDNLYPAKACGENPGAHSTELGQSGRDVAGCGKSSTAERHSQGIRKDVMNSKEPESHRSEHINETGRDAMYQGTDMKGQSANSGQRSKGHKPGSSRRRDLAGMFAWN
ncbi:methenyltetrahydrofolate synthase domain-containing protein [Strongylocentrotus purpuratus]|uniref:Methenyltetrahydrofolate synthase domain-containing protein n=1 Tax=Strongylocentrotus purpuratus TaxID=7668 RepID=A0A7M7PF59_STRPU|nr:methenyltetrahydrofolate synthase domain-containing protein [Strongylocentrotus purpuratus]